MRLMSLLGLLATVVMGSVSGEERRNEIPAAYARFEPLIGGWKGQGIPAKNRIKGWPERHLWSWRFAKGKPIGMALEVTGGKIVSKAQFSKDEATGKYRLEGTDPMGQPIAFSGKLDESKGVLSLEREAPPASGGQERLDLSLNESGIRYAMRLLRRESDAPQFAPAIDVNLGKEGETFAAGGAAADLPKCIVTGGAGSMSVSYEGKSYPICCSGCRDEFRENPAKYVKKFLARAQKGDETSLKTTASAPTSQADAPSEATKSMPKSKGSTTKRETSPSKKAEEKPSADKTDPATKAAGLLAQGQALEKSGKPQAALIYFKRVVREYPESPAATTARSRIKALGG